jgi:DNA-binding beta-propeller fold protein YncE
MNTIIATATRFIPTLLLIVLALALFTGCATGPKVAEDAIFYPPLPNPPHIQYLHTFSNEYDLSEGGALGKFVLGEDENKSPIMKPYGVAIRNGKIFVVDARGKGYAIFDLAMKEFRVVMGSGGGALEKPINIIIDEAENRYITDTDRKQVLVFDAQDNFIRAYGMENQFKPTDVALSGNNLYVCDIEHHTIHVLDKQTGETIRTISAEGDAEDKIFKPTNIEIYGDNLLISDTFNGRVQVFTLDGEHLYSIGQLGTGLGQFARPKGVAVDREGRIYVVDAAFQNVQIFDSDQKLLLFFGAPGAGRDSMNLPATVVIDYDNIEYFRQYADPNFDIEYIILVVSQYGKNKVNAYAFGKMKGMDYTAVSAE